MITAPRTVPPFPLLAATGGLDPQELQEEQQPATTAGRGPAAEPAVGGGDRPPVVKPTKPAKPTPPRAPAAPANDPLWQTNPKSTFQWCAGD